MIDLERRYVLDRVAIELATEIREDIELMSPEEVCGLLKVGGDALSRIGLPKIKLNARVIRYRRSDVRAFLEARTH